MPTKCAITGTVVAPDGTPIPLAKVVFAPSDGRSAIGVRPLPPLSIAPEDAVATTDETGALEVELYPGQYSVRVTRALRTAFPTFQVTVPDAPFAVLSDIQNLTPPVPLNEAQLAVLAAQDARDQAREAAGEAAADAVAEAVPAAIAAVDEALSEKVQAAQAAQEAAEGAAGTAAVDAATEVSALLDEKVVAASVSASQAALYDGPWKDTVAGLAADTTLTYAPGHPGSVTTGNYIRTREEGYSYRVAAAAATDHDMATAGGVKLYALNLGARAGTTELRGGGSGTGHATVRRRDANAGAGLWLQPNGYPDPAGAGAQVASFKAFFEPYDQLREQYLGVDDQFTKYRVGVYYAENKSSLKGDGRVNLGAEGNPPFCPEVHLGGMQNGAEVPFRAVYAHSRPINAGNYFSGGLATFAEGETFWRPGMAVTQGQIVHLAGRIYEAQAAGTTGPNIPLHARYRLRVLTVADSSAFQAGEYINITPYVNANVSPLGRIYDKPSGTKIRIYAENNASFANLWAPGQNIIGQTSGATTAVTSLDANEYFDHDYGPAYSISQSMAAAAVPGRIASDGAVSWNFIDDLTVVAPYTKAAFPLTIMGGLGVTPVWYDPTIRYQLGGGTDLALLDGSGLRLFSPSDRSKRWDLKWPDANMLRFQHTDGYEVEFNQFTKSVNLNGFALTLPTAACANGATTMNVDGIGGVTFTSGGATMFTGFTGGQDGQIIHCRFIAAGPTLVHANGSFELGGANVVPKARGGMTFMKFGTIWVLTGAC